MTYGEYYVERAARDFSGMPDAANYVLVGEWVSATKPEDNPTIIELIDAAAFYSAPMVTAQIDPNAQAIIDAGYVTADGEPDLIAAVAALLP